VRLAFAVAAHLDSEILIVDEVLAVGDAEFQAKCLEKMGDISKGGGRTVLFVSHNLGSISQLCSKTILLKNGILFDIGNTEKIINRYLDIGNSPKAIIKKNNFGEENYFEMLNMTDRSLGQKYEYKFDEEICINVMLKTSQNTSSLELAMRLLDKYKRPVFTIHHPIIDQISETNKSVELLVVIPKKFITPNVYSWTICINQPGVKFFDLHEDVLSFSVLDTGSDFARYDGQDYGMVFPDYTVHEIGNK
jgi:lipopolysaccharide transport system ATP-binding protein